jgi:sugar phosphate isomerase/epimerase
MQYAFMSFSTPELSLTEMLEVAARFGYDGVEPRLECRHRHGVELDTTAAQRRQIKDAFARSGIKAACIATSLRYADPAVAAAMVEQGHRSIDLAADVGAPCLRVFGGRMGAGLSRAAAIEVLAQALRSLADHAAERQVTVCLETHDDWIDPAHVAEVMRQVDHPAVAVNWDIMHPVRTGKATIEQSFQALRPWVRHLHVHDGAGPEVTLVPIGQGDIDHRQAIALLKSVGYPGFISGEWIDWEPWQTHLPRELATLKRYEAEA